MIIDDGIRKCFPKPYIIINIVLLKRKGAEKGSPQRWVDELLWSSYPPWHAGIVEV